MLPIHSAPDEELTDGPPMIIGGKRMSTSSVSASEYIGRMFRYRQMDFDYTFSQMVYLCFAPAKVYQLTQYRKRTKGQWARDDPGFIVIQLILLSAAGWAYGICFGETGLDQFKTFFYFIIGHFILLGIFVATISRLVADKWLRRNQGGSTAHGVSQSIEWLYSFDVHCNAFFPLFLLTYVIQYLGLPFLYSPSLVSVIVSNLIHTCAVSYYCYILTLGYKTLPYIDRGEIFMVPAIIFSAIVIILCVFKKNLTIVFVEWTTGMST
jgi:hypothetical protein